MLWLQLYDILTKETYGDSKKISGFQAEGLGKSE